MRSRQLLCFLALVGSTMVATESTAFELTLTWTDSSDGEAGFKIERSLDGSSFAEIATTDAGQTSYTDSNIDERSYWYRVRAFNGDVVSDYSNVSAFIKSSGRPSLEDSGMQAPPTIVTQPMSLTAVPGGTAVFSASASGSLPVSWQWFKNGLAMGGATSETLTLMSLTSNDVASYFAVASNSAGSATTATANLSVQALLSNPREEIRVAPTISTQPASQTAQPSQTVAFFASASGSPDLSWQWYKNGVPMAGAISNTLVLASLTSNDVAWYSVVATNSAGSATSEGALLLVESAVARDVAPVITTQPVSQLVQQGLAVAFSASATGSPSPSLQWYKNGVPLAGATSDTLNLTSLTANDVASYYVTATNSAGSVTSASALLQVAPPALVAIAPVIRTQPLSQTGVPFGTVSLFAVASGSPAPTWQWYKNGILLAGATSDRLSLAGLSTNDVASYFAVATNSAGSAASDSVSVLLSPEEAVTPNPTQPPTAIPHLLSSASGWVGPNIPLICQFSVSGDTPKRILIWAAGNSINLPVNGQALDDPRIDLFSGNDLLLSNDNWNETIEIEEAIRLSGLSALAQSANDAALLVVLPPGAYTVGVSSSNETHGMAVIDVIEF